MYICVKLFFGELNIGLYPPHPTSTYTCEVTIIPRVCGDIITRLLHAWKVGLMMVSRLRASQFSPKNIYIYISKQALVKYLKCFIVILVVLFIYFS